jgi:hypothetical protein
LITAPAIVHAGNIMRVKPFAFADGGALTFGPFPNEPRIMGLLIYDTEMGLLIYDTEAQAFVPLGRVGQLEWTTL